jgi:hypothetical protein
MPQCCFNLHQRYATELELPKNPPLGLAEVVDALPSDLVPICLRL